MKTGLRDTIKRKFKDGTFFSWRSSLTSRWEDPGFLHPHPLTLLSGSFPW